MHRSDAKSYFGTMVGAVILVTLLPALVACAGEGNIRLLEDEVAVALKACSIPDTTSTTKEPIAKDRQRRSDDSFEKSRIDGGVKQANLYHHEKRNTNNSGDQIQVINDTDYDYEATGNTGDEFLTSAPRLATTGDNNIDANTNVRTRRSEPLLNKPDLDLCLSQCVFANLQVVDARGIPREAELWDKVQSAVTSQQSRSALHDQIRACFQELQSEAEDNGCSYSNKLERCLMLRFSDRKLDGKGNTTKPQPAAL